MRETSGIRRAVQPLVVALGLCLGCSGEIGGEQGGEAMGPGSSQNPPAGGGAPGGGGGPGNIGVILPNSGTCTESPAIVPMRRLTRFEYDNTVLDLLKLKANAQADFPAEAGVSGFDNHVDGAVFSSRAIESYEASATRLAAQATADLPALLGCDPATVGEDACALPFVSSFGKRAFRRPLDTEEKNRFEEFYRSSKATYGFAEALRMLVQGVLQSPSFLYRVEAGIVDPAQSDFMLLSSWEMASRLSYLLTGSMPDAELMTAAEADALRSPEQIRAQAERLLKSEGGSRIIRNFATQWGSLRNLPGTEKEDAAFSPKIRELLKTETETFFDEVIRNGEGTLKALLTAPHSYLNQELASFYGVSGPTSESFVRTELDPARYSGLLTQAGLLALHSHPGQPSVVKRGEFVMEQLLCVELPTPPNNIDAKLPEPDPNATAREQLTQLTSGSACSSCHTLINPAGYAFEHFDETGRYRTTEHGLPVDSSGVLAGSDVDGPFDDHLDLAGRLSTSTRVKDCMVKHWFRYAYGRDLGQEQCSVEQLRTAFGSGDFKSLLLALTQTPAFMYRAGATKAGNP